MKINIKKINTDHKKAMQYAQLAFVEEQNGNINKALKLYYKAYELEKNAAYELIFHIKKEPTRSILFRSAASLAKKCNLIQEANDLVKLGLNGNPPLRIKEELNQLLTSLKFVKIKHNIQIKGTKIKETRPQLRLAARAKAKLTKNEIIKIKQSFL